MLPSYSYIRGDNNIAIMMKHNDMFFKFSNNIFTTEEVGNMNCPVILLDRVMNKTI